MHVRGCGHQPAAAVLESPLGCSKDPATPGSMSYDKGKVDPKFGDGPRIVLCIGKDEYPNKELSNCVADAMDMGDCCEQRLGFNTVIVRTNANKKTIMQVVREVRDEHVKSGFSFIFFFSGML